ncbi:MAG: 4-hydroxy-tetrahydrodipicolinate reductase [Candidatus Hodarchaeota archaeon]
MIKLGLLGSDGSMGRLIGDLAIKDDDITIIAAYTIPSSPNIGTDIGSLTGNKEQDVKIVSIDKLEDDLKDKEFDVFVDFTLADATEKYAPPIMKSGIPMVIGTTALSGDFMKRAQKLSEEKKIPLVISSNMAIGVNVVFKVAAELAKALEGWEVEIVEMHHHRKKDAPSGTAATILKNIAEARGLDVEKIAKYGRDKGPNPRKKGDDEIGVHAIRAGDIVGDHVILYAGNGERIELKHQAHSRSCFASGAIKAIKFVMENKGKPKIYNMHDVLF